MTAWIVIGLVVYAAIWLTVGFIFGVRRHRDPIDRWDPATAMRNATPQDVPAETARLNPEQFADQDETLALPDLNNETIAIGAPTGPALPATTKPAEPLHLTPVTTTSVAPWDPPEPRIVLAVAWHPPDAQRVWDRFDITDPVPMPNNQTAEEGEWGVKSWWQVLDSQRREYGGVVKIRITVGGRLAREWKDAEDYDVWTREAVPVIIDAHKSIDAIRQARDQLQQVNA